MNMMVMKTNAVNNGGCDLGFEELEKQFRARAGDNEDLFLELLKKRVLDQIAWFYIDKPPLIDQYHKGNNSSSGSTSDVIQVQQFINEPFVPKKNRGSNGGHGIKKPDQAATNTIARNFNALRSLLCNDSRRDVYYPDRDDVPAECAKNGKESINEKKTKRANGKRKPESDDEDYEERNAKKAKKRSIPKRVDFAKLGLEPPPELSEESKEFIKQSGGTDVKLVIMKQLFKTDLQKHQDRLSMPVNQVRDKSFPTETEEEQLAGGGDIDVNLIEPVGLNVSRMKLRNWSTNSQYALTSSWIQVVDRNKDVLTLDSIVQVWSLRVNGRLWFVLVKVRDGVVDDDMIDG